MGVQMSETYTLSWCSKERVAYLKRRPWWNLFGCDAFEYRVMEQRRSIFGIPEDEVAMLGANPHFGQGTLGRLLVRLMGKDVWMVQLETENSRGSHYITTSAYVDTK